MAKITPNTREEQDAAYSPETLNKREGSHDNIPGYNRKSDGLDDHPISAGAADGKSNITNAGNRESNPAANWKTNVTNSAAQALSGGKGASKSKSPLVAILVILFGGGFSFAGLFGAFSLLPIDVVSQFLNKEDAQSTSFSIRTDKIINDKISKNTTSGYCGATISLLCKYERPSNKLLRALDKEGIQALDKAGNVMKGTGSPFNSRPIKYTFKGKPIDPSDFSSKLANDAEFRAAFHSAYTPRFVTFADKIFQGIKDRFKLKLTDKLKGTKNATETGKALDESSKGPETGAKAAASDAETFMKKELEAAATKELEGVAKSGKGNAVGLIAGGVCAIADIPGLIITVVRAYQMLQLVNYATTVLSTIGAWKAGDAQPQEISALGDMLTTTVAGQSAMDSFGIKNTLFGDTKTTDSYWKNYSPGASVIGSLGNIAQVTSSTIKQQACSIATNPATGVAIDAALAPETLGIGTLLNTVGGVLAGSLLGSLAGPIMNHIFTALPPDIFQPILTYFLGDLTQGLVGVKVGDALSSGIVHLLGQTANKGGNMPLTVKQKLAYDNVTAQVNLAYAQEDRATHSPFDASNPNTLLGSFVTQLLPYYGNMGSVAGVFSSLSSIITGSVGSIFGQPAANAASADGSQYTLCSDPSISSPFGSDPIAAGPFCNIEYGIPPKYLDKDPEQVAHELQDKGQIDPITGDVIPQKDPPISIPLPGDTSTQDQKGSLSGWIDLCTDGSNAHAADCQITDDTADYALYVIDHRIQTTMDGEDATLDPSTAPATPSAPAVVAPVVPAATTVPTNTTTPSTPAVSTPTTTPPAVPVTGGGTGTSFIDTQYLTTSKLLAYMMPPKKIESITI